MEPFKPKNNRKGPEARIQDALIKYLRERSWFVKVLHGNVWQSGMPDLYCINRKYGRRFIEVKHTIRFTPAQWKDFPVMVANGERIWVLTAATDGEYAKLFQPPNLWVYMGGNHK